MRPWVCVNAQLCCVWPHRFYNPNSDYDTAEKEELAEECKSSGDEEILQERPVIAKFLVRMRAGISPRAQVCDASGLTVICSLAVSRARQS